MLFCWWMLFHSPRRASRNRPMKREVLCCRIFTHTHAKLLLAKFALTFLWENGQHNNLLTNEHRSKDKAHTHYAIETKLVTSDKLSSSISSIKTKFHQVHWFSVKIINPLTKGQMVIKLAANKFLSQNDFLIWEELLLCEEIYSGVWMQKLCSVPGNHWMLIWAYLWKWIFGILRIVSSTLLENHCCSFEHTITIFFKWNFGILRNMVSSLERSQFTHHNEAAFYSRYLNFTFTIVLLLGYLK